MDEIDKSLLDKLIIDSQLYKSSKDYMELLDFTVRLRNFAPFNSMLLHIQKPGIKFAASRHDWWERFKCTVTEDARPLLILWPFSPVALVYDLLDVEGPIPEDAFCFPADGAIDESKLLGFEHLLKNFIFIQYIDQGDSKAGLIQVEYRPSNNEEHTQYLIKINKNHKTTVKFTTLIHELGHLFLGHLGEDGKLKIKNRNSLSYSQREIEAESVAYIICNRSGVKPKSQKYLSTFIEDNFEINELDVYQVLKAAGRVEKLLNLSESTAFE